MSQTSATASSFSVTCPGCGQRLRFSLGVEVPARVRIQCSACQTAFTVRRPGAESPAASLTGVPTPPTYVGIPVASTPPPAVAPPPRPQPSAASAASAASPAASLAPPRRRFGEAAFVPGEVIAGRYEVVRFIARGGMGEVYEVEDRELRERVALKTVRSEVARDTIAIERFKREIQLARKVTHPNVCRIFDVAHHRFEGPAGGWTGGEGESLIFLTMELLPGETLADRIRRDGKMAPEAALPIVRQVAEALHAAHQAGVVHRDLKPGNVLLIEGRGGPAAAGTPRAVVTDFGLARLEGGAESGGGMPALTMTSAGVIGTPAYLAPEQVDGTEITAAVDIYSLGIVLYEMLTGTVPFVGETALMTAVKRLREAPPSPRVHTPGLDPRWEAVILRCLERAPAARFADAR
ncbi:MAG TPA: serine/threonine-protein kinase, partial [Thermoanaerobaculia bacterium]|nr:serine/threonine-protein kinase [Thermoanaerobaculia bacterium]